MRRALLVVVVSLAACGDNSGGNADARGSDGGDDTPDGPPPIGSCGAVAATISTYPGTFAGVTLGAGADLDVAQGACAEENGWFTDAGDEQVIALTDLTPGTAYVVDLQTPDDLTFWVTTECADGGPAPGACLLHNDEFFMNELGAFVAPAEGRVYLVIDASNDPAPPVTGEYTVEVKAAECQDDPDCTNPSLPFCVDFTCVECTNSFECPGAGTPICTDNVCVAGPDQCTGDDGNEPDDGPAAATMIPAPTPSTPTVRNGAVCSLPSNEADFYRFTLTGTRSIRLTLNFSGAGTDLDVYLLDSDGFIIEAGILSGTVPEVFVAQDLPPGDYYVLVRQYDPMASAAATPYTLRLAIPDCETDFDCVVAGTPVCEVGQCVAGPSTCTNDDAADGGAGDAGPAVARDATAAVGTPRTFNARACNTPDAEADWYRVNVLAGQGVRVSSSFGGALDFDIAAFDGNGNLVGLTFWLNPEVVVLDYLPAGPVYFRVVLFADPPETAASPYSITFTRTAAQTCASRNDCDNEYSNQIFRGRCAGGTCQFIPPGTRANGAQCDSGDDCNSGICSYIAFESDAAKSVCTIECTDTAGCSGINGTTCTSGFSGNICIPSCNNDLQCGASPGSPDIEVGQPWDYFTCTASTGVCSP